MTHSLRAAVAFCIVLVPAIAAADAKVGVVVTGDDDVHAVAEHAANDWLGRRNFGIESKPLDPDGVITLANCLAMADMACARGVVEKRSKAESVVVIVAQASSTKAQRELQLSAYWISKNHDVVSLQRMCNQCKDDVLPKTVGDLMSDLSRLVPALTGKIEIASTPPGLLASIDGEAVGITPLVHDETSGPHDVAVSRDGKVIEQKKVTVTAGETVRVAVVAPVEKPKPTTMVIHRSRLVPAIVLVTGIAATAAGVVMIVKGGPTGAHKSYTDYRTPGEYAVTPAGAALTILGVFLMARAGTYEVPVVAATPGGAMVGWMGRF